MDPSKNPSETNENTNSETLAERLRAHPNLLPLVQRMLDLADDSLPGNPSAHQVEDQAYQLMQEVGNQVLSDWSQSTHDHAVDEARRLRPDLINHRKKNSSGIVDSEPSD